MNFNQFSNISKLVTVGFSDKHCNFWCVCLANTVALTTTVRFIIVVFICCRLTETVFSLVLLFLCQRQKSNLSALLECSVFFLWFLERAVHLFVQRHFNSLGILPKISIIKKFHYSFSTFFSVLVDIFSYFCIRNVNGLNLLRKRKYLYLLFSALLSNTLNVTVIFATILLQPLSWPY